MLELAKTEEEMYQRMRECMQTSGVNMIKHGEMVHEAYVKLIKQLDGGDQVIDLPP